MKHGELTEKIIKAFFKVYNSLGYGFREKVYENAMYIELTELGTESRKTAHVQSILQTAASWCLLLGHVG